MIKKKELIITACVLICAVACLLLIKLASKDAAIVKITEDNEVLYTVSLYKDAVIELEHNTVVVQKGKVYVSRADCKNQICVNTGKISKKGEQIICLPNKIIVEVKGDEN